MGGVGGTWQAHPHADGEGTGTVRLCALLCLMLFPWPYPALPGHALRVLQRAVEQQSKLALSLAEENEAITQRCNEQVGGSTLGM